MAQAHAVLMDLGRVETAVQLWFHQNPILPPSGLTAGRIQIEHNGSFERLLQIIIDSPFQNFILVIHGYSDGYGLLLPITRRQSGRHTTYLDLASLMEQDRNARQTGRLGIGKPDAENLVNLMHKVWDKNIQCIEFRSCNLGRNRTSLDRFRQFFDANLVGAPDLHSLFGFVDVATGAEQLANHARQHPPRTETYQFPSALKSPDLVCCLTLNNESKPESWGHVVADSAPTISSWLNQYFSPQGRPVQGALPLHALWIADEPVLNRSGQPDRYVPVVMETSEAARSNPLADEWGVPDFGLRRLIPPLTDGYAKHVIYSR